MNGYLRWQPLVDESAFEAAVGSAMGNLLKEESFEYFGDYLEFGVSRGTSMSCMSRLLRNAGLKRVRMIGFDSFEGMPQESVDQGWTPGGFHSTEFATRRYLSNRGVPMSQVTLVKGWFEDTLKEETKSRLGIATARVMMVDCDIYTATRDVLRFCAPLIPERALMIFDDWGWRSDVGECGQKEAFEEFLEEHPDIKAEPLPAYIPQARIFLLERPAEKAASSRAPVPVAAGSGPIQQGDRGAIDGLDAGLLAREVGPSLKLKNFGRKLRERLLQGVAFLLVEPIDALLCMACVV
ncbi:MAG: TylF/MycF/NovP-related O-methyltransferase [Panacagrimonas sp.]